MVAVPVKNVPPLSLVEQGVAWMGRRARVRAARTGRPVAPSVVGWWLAELLGTLGALGAFTVGAFLYAPPLLAYVVLGVALLVLDTKVSGARRRRAAASQSGDSAQQSSTEVEPVRPKPMSYR